MCFHINLWLICWNLRILCAWMFHQFRATHSFNSPGWFTIDILTLNKHWLLCHLIWWMNHPCRWTFKRWCVWCQEISMVPKWLFLIKLQVVNLILKLFNFLKLWLLDREHMFDSLLCLMICFKDVCVELIELLVLLAQLRHLPYHIRQESLMYNFKGVADHVIGLVKSPKRR